MHAFIRTTATLLVVTLAACNAPAPRRTAEEYALPPVTSNAWEAVETIREGDWFLPLNTGSEALAWRLRAIRSATRSLDLQTFLWTPDPVGALIYTELIQAADRGVRVRVLLDDAFTMHEALALSQLHTHENVSVRIYNPFTHRPDNAMLRELFNLGEFSRINHRMHNKVLIIDGRASIVGGRNLADEYYGYDPAFNFRDMELLTFGTHVQSASTAFDRYWNSPWATPFAQLTSAPSLTGAHTDTQLNLIAAQLAGEFRETDGGLRTSWQQAARAAIDGAPELYFDEPAGERPGAPEAAPVQLAQRLLALIDEADSEISLVSAYLIPTPELEQAIMRAERRGVSVRILTNSLKSNNHLAAHSAYQDHVRQLLADGADLHEVRAQAQDRNRHMQNPVAGKRLGLHAKLMVIDDDQVFVGSCNLDPRSLRLNTEMGLIIESRDLNAAMRRYLSVDFHPANAWKVSVGESGALTWTGAEGAYPAPPDVLPIERLEDWFLGQLPIDSQM